MRENNAFTNQTVTYTYDVWGNLTEKKLYAYTTATDPGTPISTISYGYSTGEWKDQLVSYDGQSIVYDAMGNPTTYRGKTLTWRGKQLTGITDGTDVIAYGYDENGLRQQKTVNNVATDYCYNGSVLIGLTKGSDTLRFSYDAAGLAQAVNHNGTYYYYLRNGQGDIVKIVDGSGATVVEYSYDSWGKQLSCTGTLATTLGTLNPFRYRGYVYDEETQWYYLKSRYYDPETCRFISADVLLSTGQGVLGHNCYAYCRNNPIDGVDSDGIAPWSWLTYWGEVHRYVQDEIREIYGFTIEKWMANMTIRLDIINQSAFWEVKSAGPAALHGLAQINSYIERIGDNYIPGTGIAPHYFTKPSKKNGKTLHIFYWEDPDVKGLVKYVFAGDTDQLLRDVSKIGVADWIYEILKKEISAQNRTQKKGVSVGITAGICVGAAIAGYALLSFGSGGTTRVQFELFRP